MTVGIRQLMGELERVTDAFQVAVYTRGDRSAALANVAADCLIGEQPAGTGARGIEQLRRYLEVDVLPYRPADLAFHRLSRTTDRWRVVDEFTVSFTHDRPMPWLLPGRTPTGRRAEVTAISITAVRSSRITSRRTLWDQSALLAQLGLDPEPALRAP